MLASSLLQVPSTGLGSVVNITAVSSLCCLINSFRMRCWARQGRSLKLIGRFCVEYVEPRRESALGDEECCLLLSETPGT